jgi:hypothetical protein
MPLIVLVYAVLIEYTIISQNFMKLSINHNALEYMFSQRNFHEDTKRKKITKIEKGSFVYYLIVKP